MLTDFHTISDNSKLWIYGSNKTLSLGQEEYILEKIGRYLQNWEYHKNPLTAAVKILESRFIVIALDHHEYGVGGCSIDSLQRIIQQLEIELDLSLFNRLNVFCKIKDEVHCVSSIELKSIATSDTLFYDLSIEKKSDLNTYLKPISDGWCSRFI